MNNGKNNNIRPSTWRLTRNLCVFFLPFGVFVCGFLNCRFCRQFSVFLIENIRFIAEMKGNNN